MRRHLLTILLWLLPFVLPSFLTCGVIAVLGDTQGNGEIATQTFAAIALHQPDIAFHVGDLTPNGGKPHYWERFHAQVQPLADICSLHPARGNHDGSPEQFLAQFPSLGANTYYTIPYDSLLFIVLDSNLSLSPGSSQYKWLQGILTVNDANPRIVLMHHPVFSSGYHGGNQDRQLYLPAMLAKNRVVAVVSGHDHNYERLEYDNVTYLVTGGGGGHFRTERNPAKESRVFALRHHYLILEREGANLRCTAYSLEGEILDSFSLSLD